MKSKGLGDDIEKFITKPLGIKKAVDTVAKAVNKDCGCDKRKATLNKWFPKKGHLTQDEFDYLTMFFDSYNGKRLNNEQERDTLYRIYNKVYRTNEKPTTCSACLRSIIEDLRYELSKYDYD
jgi:hypothetical protein